MSKVMVSGCFDQIHSGHISFLMEAAKYGDLYVSVGSDKTVEELRGHAPYVGEKDRLYMIKSLSCVKDAFVPSGIGLLDFENDIQTLKPDILVVNEDGNIPQKRALCGKLGVKYIILKRDFVGRFQQASHDESYPVNHIPYRIDLAGGWLDQPFVSKFYPGPVITLSIEPTIEFNERSGMASSTRRKAVELWGTHLPSGDLEKTGKMLFCYDNPPGVTHVSGSQDSIGIVFPALNKSNYAGEYWPKSIDNVHDESTLRFLEQNISLVPLGQRHSSYDVLNKICVDVAGATRLSVAAEECWKSILAKDVAGFGRHCREGFEAQVAMFPGMMVDTLADMINEYKSQAVGWKVSGAGGGGYLVLISDKEIDNAIRIRARRVDSK